MGRGGRCECARAWRGLSIVGGSLHVCTCARLRGEERRHETVLIVSSVVLLTAGEENGVWEGGEAVVDERSIITPRAVAMAAHPVTTTSFRAICSEHNNI